MPSYNKLALQYKVDGCHLWGAAPFNLNGRDFFVASVWPESAGFSGWRTASKIHLFSIDYSKSSPQVNHLGALQLESHEADSLINPRVVVHDEKVNLFYSRVFNENNYEIFHANIDLPDMGVLSLPTALIPFDGPQLGPQGPTNPAVTIGAGNLWHMLFRTSDKIYGQRNLFSAFSVIPEGPWHIVGPIKGLDGHNLEDPFLWFSDGIYKCLVRDCTGVVTGKNWASIGQMESQDCHTWSPSHPSHILNRSRPNNKGKEQLMHRLERPALSINQSLTDKLYLSALSDETATAGLVVLETSNSQTPEQDPKPEDIITSVRKKNLTYLSEAAFDNIKSCIADLKANNRFGDFCEFGVALGGSAIYLASELNDGRRFFGFDVFDMIPPPNEKDDAISRQRYETISQGLSKGIGGDEYYGYKNGLRDFVISEFENYCLDVDGKSIYLVAGLFEKTLLEYAEDLTTISIAHIDCDWFDPVNDCLEFVKSRMCVGGYIIIDDFNAWKGARRATLDFLRQNENYDLVKVQPNVIIKRMS